jgi:hypothetical protein
MPIPTATRRKSGRTARRIERCPGAQLRERRTYADEVIGVVATKGLGALDRIEVADREVPMAEMLVEPLTASSCA